MKSIGWPSNPGLLGLVSFTRTFYSVPKLNPSLGTPKNSQGVQILELKNKNYLKKFSKKKSRIQETPTLSTGAKIAKKC